MKIVLRITDNGRTAVARVQADDKPAVAVLNAYLRVASELNLSTKIKSEPEVEEDSRSDEKWFEDQE